MTIKTGVELDLAAETARKIADRVMMGLKLRGVVVDRDELKANTVVLRETIRDQAQDVLLYHT